MIKIKRGWERQVNKTADSDLVRMSGNEMNE